nr:hypothetical protein [Tanacetum cinerariifolium]
KESNDDSDDGSDKDSKETVKSGAGKDEDDDDDDEEEETVKDDEELKDTGTGGDEGRGLQVTQSIEDTHVILTPVNLDDPQDSSFMSSFVSSMLNPLSDEGVESIFTTTS